MLRVKNNMAAPNAHIAIAAIDADMGIIGQISIGKRRKYMSDNGEIKRMTKRPKHLDLPYDLSPNKPVPQPKEGENKGEPGREKPDPVRYGDWEAKGIAIDF